MLSRTSAALAAAAAIAAAGASVGVASPGTGVTAHTLSALPSLDGAVVARINAVRAARGLARLRISPGLRASARAHSLDMARRGYFAHDSADGMAADDRIKRFYGSRGYSSWQIGETLLWYSPDVGAAAAVADWLSDVDHRRILLDPGFREIGASAVHATGVGGEFNGLTVTLITADFGARSR